MRLPRRSGWRTAAAAALFSALPVAAAAQVAPVVVPGQPLAPMLVAPPLSQLDALLASADTLVVQDLYRVGDAVTMALGVTVDAVIATEKSPVPRVERGIRLQLRDAAHPDQIVTSYVDLDEVVALSAALADMAQTAGAWNNRDGARAIQSQFTTTDGFSVSFYQDVRNQRATLAAGFVSPVRRSFNISDLATVKSVIDEALSVLQSK